MDNRSSSKSYKRIDAEGIVQGVGFRPFIYRLAKKYNITGTVCNVNGSVEIKISGSNDDIEQFINSLRSEAKFPIVLKSIKVSNCEAFEADKFEILSGRKNSEKLSRQLSPDLCICPDCLEEILSTDDRRSGYVFNTCINCGPRFSIIENLPYDRNNTSMKDFELCGCCYEEYVNPADRRFHAETVSCSECGPDLVYEGYGGVSTTGRGAVFQAIEELKNGGIIAIKGIGGYHFACSPFDSIAVKNLRILKYRDQKPLAVMFKNTDCIKAICRMNKSEYELVVSSQRPIVLLELISNIFANELLFSDRRCGCFLPYTPMHHLILEHLDMMVLTSANISGSAITYKDQEMLDFFRQPEMNNLGLLKGVLYNNREILRPVEDSVAQTVAGRVQLIRRSRGYVPVPIDLRNKNVYLATGGDLKASFCIVDREYAYLSQYFGDLDNKTVYNTYVNSIKNWQQLYNISPQFVLKDMHPLYLSSKYADDTGLPVISVQHHHAHVTSVMAEHAIYDQEVIGIAFDGTGYGDDGAIWGGEFLICRNAEFERVGHIEYKTLVGGDTAVVDAGKTALCYLLQSGCDVPLNFDDRLGVIRSAIENNINSFKTSSIGRLFDAVSSLLGICSENTYEGECAIKLQQCAEWGVKNVTGIFKMGFDIREENSKFIASPDNIINTIFNEFIIANKATAEVFALGFHLACTLLVRDICLKIREQRNINSVILAGGVFQNKLLCETTIELLEIDGFKVSINNLTVPSDGSIALGQAYIGGFL